MLKGQMHAEARRVRRGSVRGSAVTTGWWVRTARLAIGSDLPREVFLRMTA
jgi:hypothetical protein